MKDEFDFKRPSDDEARSLVGEIHEGVCGAHQSAFKMKWMIRRNGYYWPTILEDCFKYFKGCQGCQKVDNIQRAPAFIQCTVSYILSYLYLAKDHLIKNC